MNGLLLLGICGLLGWVWLDGARARELATELARTMCDRHGVQFLDDTVNLSRMGIRWTSNGLRIRRMFYFDFSREGTSRFTGTILLVGTDVEYLDIGQGNTVDTTSPTTEKPGPENDKVVPFRRPKDR